jgi:LAO/AO transport system kinase
MDFAKQASLVQAGDVKALAHALTLAENHSAQLLETFQHLTFHNTPVVGITGPPGAGKSTLVNALVSILAAEKKVAVLAVDPSSPFTHGAMLGDRLRMSEHFLNPHVFIRSVATRGSLGGLNHSAPLAIDLLRAAPFDIILVETVGTGQTELDIATLADTTVVVLVPESGDEVQTMKAG